jgi:hypothetical protein
MGDRPESNATLSSVLADKGRLPLVAVECRCLSRRMGSTARPRRAVIAGRSAVTGLAIVGFLVVASYPRWREWCLTWGATDAEATGAIPGDELLIDADIVSTRAASIEAPPESVWPWLAQMGSGRGGLYTYDWIENLLGLHMHSVRVILPDFQDVAVGDAQTLGKRGPTLRVAICDPKRALVVRSDDGNWVWAFSLERSESGTRLISRNRISTPGASRLARLFYRYFMEPGSLVMERKMLLGIKQRAEGLAMATGKR